MAEPQSTVLYGDVPEFPGYRVGDDGSVWSCLRNSRGALVVDGWHPVVGGLDKDGYKKVILCAGDRRRHARVSVLVLEVFRGPAPPGMVAAHENGVRTDNRLSNLRWDTQKNNVADKVRHGTAQVGEKHPQSVLTCREVAAMRECRRGGMKFKEIADQFRRGLPTVYAAVSGRNWKHVG